jgi:hypothetical protein
MNLLIILNSDRYILTFLTLKTGTYVSFPTFPTKMGWMLEWEMGILGI